MVVLPDLKGSREVRKEMRIRAMTATFRPCGCVVEEAISMGLDLFTVMDLIYMYVNNFRREKIRRELFSGV